MMSENILEKFLGRLHIDWWLFIPSVLISLAGLVTMNSFSGENYFFFRQSIWILFSIIVFFVASSVDWRFLRNTKVLMTIFLATLAILLLLLLLGETKRGAQSWFQIGTLTFQPVDLAKLAGILILAK